MNNLAKGRQHCCRLVLVVLILYWLDDRGQSPLEYYSNFITPLLFINLRGKRHRRKTFQDHLKYKIIRVKSNKPYVGLLDIIHYSLFTGGLLESRHCYRNV